jgi:hypothetical protein
MTAVKSSSRSWGLLILTRRNFVWAAMVQDVQLGARRLELVPPHQLPRKQRGVAHLEAVRRTVTGMFNLVPRREVLAVPGASFTPGILRVIGAPALSHSHNLRPIKAARKDDSIRHSECRARNHTSVLSASRFQGLRTWVSGCLGRLRNGVQFCTIVSALAELGDAKSIRHPKFAEYTVDVVFHSLFRKAQTKSYLLVGESLTQEFRRLLFPSAETQIRSPNNARLRRHLLPDTTEQCHTKRRGTKGPACGDGLDCRDYLQSRSILQHVSHRPRSNRTQQTLFVRIHVYHYDSQASNGNAKGGD